MMDTINDKKQRGAIYFYGGCFGLIFAVPFSLSTLSLIQSDGTTSVGDYAAYAIINVFVAAVCFFFIWRLYGDLCTVFRSDGIERRTVIRPVVIPWKDLRKVIVHEINDHPVKLEFLADEQKITVISFFYTRPDLIVQSLRDELGERVTWQYKNAK